MDPHQQLESDLGFVKQVVADADRPPRSPAAIPLLWAVIALGGFPLVDFAPRYIGSYWMVAGPAGFVISLYIGWRYGRESGQVRKSEGMRYLLHWGALLVTIGLAVILIPAGVIVDTALSPIVLLILALTYFLGGVHLERPMMAIGILLAAGYLMVLAVPRYAWTLLGVIAAVALVVMAVTGNRRAQVAG
jgi:hypothetical protein